MQASTFIGALTGNADTVTNGAYTTNNLSVFAATSSSQLKGIISDETGSGALVFATSPTLVTPALGTPASGNLASCTFPTLNQNTTGNAATVTNGVYTTSKISVLAATTSAELRGVISDETGTGGLVFATSPTLVTPVLGTPASGNFSTGSFTWPTFNQNTTGTAATVTDAAQGAITSVGTLTSLTVSGTLNVAADTNESAQIGRAHIGHMGWSDYASFSHVDRDSATGYAVNQNSSGATYINSEAGQDINFAIGGVSGKMVVDGPTGYIGIGITGPKSILHMAPSDTGGIPTNQLVDIVDGNSFTFWNQNNSATYSALKLETRTTQASGWLIGNEWKSSYNGDLFFRGRYDGTNSREVMRLTSAGNVGIGTTDPGSIFEIVGAASPQLRIKDSTNNHIVGMQSYDTAANVGTISNTRFDIISNNSERITILADGNVGINDTDPSEAKLSLVNSGSIEGIKVMDSSSANGVHSTNTGSGRAAYFNSSSSGETVRIQQDANAVGLYIDQNGAGTGLEIDQDGAGIGLYIHQNASSEAFKVHNAAGGTAAKIIQDGANTGLYIDQNGAGVALHAESDQADVVCLFKNTNGNPYGVKIEHSTDANNTSNYFLRCIGNTSSKFYVYSNGTYASISDARDKENIVDSDPALDKVLQLKVRDFNFISDTEKSKHIGFISQELEVLYPHLVNEADDEKGSKMLNSTGIIPLLTKALQELSTKVTALENA